MKHLVDFETFSTNSVNESTANTSTNNAKDAVIEFAAKLLEEKVDAKMLAEALKSVAQDIEGSEMNEGWREILDTIKGARKFVMSKYKPSKKAEETIAHNPALIKAASAAIIKAGVPKTLLQKAILATSDFFGGDIPLTDRIDFEYDPATETLKMKPKKTGSLFSGSPVMGA